MASSSQPNGPHQHQTDDLLVTQKLLRATLDSSMDMIQVFEAVRNQQAEIVDFTWILNNHAAEKMYGDVLGKSLLQVQPGVVEEGIFAAFKHVVETGQPQQYEKHYVHEPFDGWFFQSIVKLGDGVATTTADITDRKNAEQALQQSKALLQEVIDAPNIGIAVYKALRNHQGQIIDFVHEYINRASLAMLGGEDFTGKLFTDHGENGIVQLPQLIEVMETGIGNSYLREAHFRGRQVWFAITNSPLDADRLVHTWEDVTQRQNAEQTSKEQAHFIKSVTQMMPDVVSVVEFPSRTILYTNRDTLTWVGFDADELSRLSFDDRIQLFHPDDLPVIQDFYSQFAALKDRDETSVEYRLKNNQGEWILLLLRGQVFRRDEQGHPTQLLFVGQNITAQRQAEQEILRLKDEVLQSATDKYRSLFESIDEGFAIVEVVADQRGRVIDMIWREANPGVERHTGMGGWVGKRASELMPNLEQDWLDAMTGVYQTGEPVRMEAYVADLDRWMDTYYSRIGGSGSPLIASVFQDITERIRRQQQQDYLLHLSDTLRRLADPIAVQQAAMQLLGEHLQVSRAFYGDMQADQDTLLIGPGYTRDTFPLEVQVRFSEFDGDLTAYYGRGQVVVMDDVNDHPLVSEKSKVEFALIDCRAAVGVPLLKGGKVRGILSLHQRVPRHWTATDISLAQETAERTWAALERARAEEALRQSEEKYRTLFNSIDEGVATMELILDDQGRTTDWLYLEHNTALARLTGLSENIVGKKASDIYRSLEPFWTETFGRVVREGVAERFEYSVADLGNRWFEVYAARVGDAGSRQLVLVYNNISERKQQEQRQAYLLTLSDALRSIADPVAIEETVTKLALQQFAADRCYYCRIEDNKAIITRDAMQGDLPSVAGIYPLSSFVLLKNVLEKGQPFVVEDAATTPILDEVIRTICLQMQVISFLNVPVIKNGQAVGVLCTVQSTPRRWTEMEIQLAVETAERTWAAVGRAKAEEAFTKSQERLQLATQAAQIGTFIYYPQEDRGEPDAQMLALYGLPPDDTLNLTKALTQILHGYDRERYANEVAQALNPAGSGKLDCDIRIVHPDGSVHWMNVTGQVIFENGQAVRMPGVSTDITERKRQEANLVFLADISQDLARLTNIDETMDALGAKIAQHFGVARVIFGEISEDQQTDRVSHEWHRADLPDMKGSYRSKDYFSPEFERLHRAGELAVVRDAERDERVNAAGYAALGVGAWLGVPLLRQGKWRYYLSLIDSNPRDWRQDEIGLIRELSTAIWSWLERARAEEALRVSEQRLQRMINVPGVGVLTFSREGQLLSANDAFLAIVGYRLDELTGGRVTWEDFTPPEYVEASLQEFQRVLTSGLAGPYEKEYFRKDGSRVWLMFVGADMGDGTLVEYAIDISARKLAEQAWQESEKRLRTADQRKDEFLAMLAHELRNPMSTIRSGLQILTITDGKDQTSSETIAMMDRQTNHLVRMVDDLLDVSRISQGKIELKTGRVNLVELVAQAAESVQMLFQEQGRRLHIDLPTAPIYVQGDAARLSQVVTNLLTNGVRYTEESGQVWLSLIHEGQQATFQVRDNGIGLATDQLEAIFDLFVQVDNSLARSKGGLGLGLTLVKRLVELHGGWVEAQSEGVGKGSTFRVHLPTINTAPKHTPMPADEGSSAEVATQRILVVDDNADAALTLSMLLKLKGYQVHTRHSGQAGLQAVDELKPGVVLLDIGMPGMDGYATARAIRQQPWGRDAVLIALTGYGGEEDKQRTREAGFDGHLVKPVDLGELTKLLTNLLDKD